MMNSKLLDDEFKYKLTLEKMVQTKVGDLSQFSVNIRFEILANNVNKYEGA